MKYLLCALVLLGVVSIGYSANRKCYGCSDSFPDYFNGTKCSSGSPLKIDCDSPTQSCASVINESKEITKGCLINQDGSPYTLPDGCFTDALDRYIRICNKDLCNDKNKCDSAKFIRSSFKQLKIIKEKSLY